MAFFPKNLSLFHLKRYYSQFSLPNQTGFLSISSNINSTPNSFKKKNIQIINLIDGNLNKSPVLYTSRYNKNFHTEGFQSKSANLFKSELYKESSFDDAFNAVVECTTANLNQRNLLEVTDWFEKVLNYNVPHGKKNRGIALVKSYQIIASKQDLEKNDIFLAQLLGWCVEMCQAFFLIVDDIMDQSITRRGRPCWYKNEGVGLLGINDGFFLENAIYVVLKSHFSHHPNYTDLYEAFQEVIWLTISGQCLDMLSAPASTQPDLNKFTEERYSKIVLHKTAYYTINLPVKIAAILAGKKQSYTKIVEELLLKIGHYFQVQDDFIDCFGDPKVTGKLGTDIEDGKCAWPIIMALQRVTPTQRIILQENYGIKNEECQKKVKAIFVNLQIPELFTEYESMVYTSLCNEIESLPQQCEIPKIVFYGLLNAIYKRNK